MNLTEQILPKSKIEARDQGWRPKKPICSGKLKTIVLGSETWYKCDEVGVIDEPDVTQKDTLKDKVGKKIEDLEKKITSGGAPKPKSEKKIINCVGWNKLGCFSESIKKVQACLNVGVSGNFDDTLKNVLASLPSTYAYKDGFNDSDVEKICKLKQDADKQDLQSKEQAARIAQKKMEMDMFSKQYPKATTKATKTDQF